MVKFDRVLLTSFVTILTLGFIMVASSSVAVTERMHLPMFYIAFKHAVYLVIGISAFFIMSTVPVAKIQKYSFLLLFTSIFFLIILLIPGVSRPINGSTRWFFIGPVSIQPSEFAKLAVIIYMAGYIDRRNYKLKNTFIGFLAPMSILAVIAFLLLQEPDFGSVVVICATILGMLFLGGVQLRSFAVLLPFVIVVFSFLAFSSSYRVQRLTSFVDPWANQYDSGYQLVQSLLAIGRGSVFGSGLGSSIQKLSYLPEAHSDFIFAMVAEELGLVGAITVIALYAVIMLKALNIGKRSQIIGKHYAGNLSFGIGLLFVIHMIINVGVNVGLLPTKGLTLPLMSAGGSSCIIACIAMAILFRVDYENRLQLNSSS